MKILHLHTSLSSGGIEAMITGLVNQMTQRHDVDLGLIFTPKDTDVFLPHVDKSVTIKSLGKNKPGFSIRQIFKICSLIKTGRYDVVQMHGFFYYYFLAILLYHKKTKFFYTVHNDAVKENTSWDKYLVRLKKFCFKHGYIRPITISDESRKSFSDLYHVDSTLIYNGVEKPRETSCNLEEFRKTPNTKILFNPARITAQKNQVLLCQAARSLIEEGADVVVLIAGSLQDQEIYDQMSSYFCDRIIYLGEHSDAVSVMRSVDAMCLSSSWEGMPVTLLEAFACGCIPVCTPVGGIRDVVKDGYNGILARDNSLNEYIGALRRFVALDGEETVNMRKNAAASFPEFDIRNTALKYENAYSSALNNNQ